MSDVRFAHSPGRFDPAYRNSLRAFDAAFVLDLGDGTRGVVGVVNGRSDLAEMWLEHLLLLSMLQHASGSWSWGRFVVVHPAGNSDVAELCDRYLPG